MNRSLRQNSVGHEIFPNKVFFFCYNKTQWPTQWRKWSTNCTMPHYLAKNVAGKSLGAPMTLEGAAKLAVAVAGSAFAIGYLKDKGYIPNSIDK